MLSAVRQLQSQTFHEYQWVWMKTVQGGISKQTIQIMKCSESRKEGCDSNQTHGDDYVMNLFSPLRLSLRGPAALMEQRTMNNIMKMVSVTLYTFYGIVGNVGSKFSRTRNITSLIPVNLLPV